MSLFETPDETVIVGKDNTARFLNSVNYTDKVIGQFVDRCRQQPWWSNSVLVIIGDHGHPLPRADFRAEDFHIPMLWLGGALQKPAFRYSAPASQLDLAATLLQQVTGAGGRFPFSKNLADSTIQQWAFFNFNDGFGWVDKKGSVIYDNTGRREVARKGGSDAGGVACWPGDAAGKFPGFYGKIGLAWVSGNLFGK
ncbi:MAG: sulfatase-like hydrolase/transferase [Chitinophagaceae bacterium]|nr:sulfatase-like hydrolase/transferase [Chitinophagaceae bacterium]